MEIVAFGPASSKTVNISLHGFPGIRSRQNREIAEEIATVSDDRTEVFLYSGLGVAPGVFSFKKCIWEVEERIAAVLKDGHTRSIRLIGHSWGGYLALRMAALYSAQERKSVSQLVLMSPLLKFPSEERALEGLKAYKDEHPELNFGDIEALAAEMASLASEISPFDLVAGLPEDLEVLFLQAKNDVITPDENALRALEMFKRPPRFEFVETDHSFIIDRERIARRIAQFIV